MKKKTPKIRKGATEMDALFSGLTMLSGMLADFGSYESRVVERTWVKGLIVSTAFTTDAGYETAIIDKSEPAVHPVQRYGSRADAVAGHKAWVKKAATVKVITKLGDAAGVLAPEKVTLKRGLPKEDM